MHVQEEIDSGDGLGDLEGQPFPKGWPKGRPKLLPEDFPAKTVEEAFQWPLVVRKNLEHILGNMNPADGKPLITTGKRLKTTSHFSGVCTQSRAAMVVEGHGMGVKFRHEARLVYAVYFVVHFFFPKL